MDYSLCPNKRILLCGNCQMSGIAFFLRRALPTWEIHDLPHLATFYGEFTEEQIAAEHAWADIVFFHHKHDGKQDYPTKHPKIPMSVWFQSAPFMAQVPGEIWQQLKESNADPEWIVREADLDYERRWEECWEKMKQKEIDEGVPVQLRISDLMRKGRERQLQLTCNHPTTYVFTNWCNRILNYIWAQPNLQDIERMCAGESNPNLAGLPCEESATTGARKHLSLNWGGRPEDDESGREICRKMLA